MMTKPWRAMCGMAAIVPVVWAVPAWAADQETVETAPTPSAAAATTETANPQQPMTYQAPQGPEPAVDAAAPVVDAVGYKPIPDSMLPMAVTPIIKVSGEAGPAPVPTPTNLGGAIALPAGPYTLGRDDVVQIAVRGQPDFTGTYAIGPDGKIQYGFLGDVSADGLTKEELRDVLAERLKQYVRNPSVQVSIIGFNSKAIYILGRVVRPGKYAMRGDTIKIRDAVIAAGLVIRHAKLRTVHIIKSDPNDPTYRVLDLFKVLYKGKMKDNIDLVSGDIIVIPTTVWGGINDFLGELISPAGHAGSVAALAAL